MLVTSLQLSFHHDCFYVQHVFLGVDDDVDDNGNVDDDDDDDDADDDDDDDDDDQNKGLKDWLAKLRAGLLHLKI